MERFRSMHRVPSILEPAASDDPSAHERRPGASNDDWFRDPVVVFREPLQVSPARARALRERALRVLAERSSPRAVGGGSGR
jgi:hypothetical protein